jgi:hypothetical protein
MSSSLHLQLLTPWTLNCTDDTHSLHSRLHSDLLHYADLTTLCLLVTLYYWLSLTDFRTDTILLALRFIPALTLYWLDSAWSVDWYSLRAFRADSPKTPLATSVLLSRHVPRHNHPGISLVCWPLPSRKRSPTVAQSLLLSVVTCACAL